MGDPSNTVLALLVGCGVPHEECCTIILAVFATLLQIDNGYRIMAEKHVHLEARITQAPSFGAC
jgi:hypothetical protein